MKKYTLPNLIIAGTVKAGTTSLFRYLSKHPKICTSKVKETCYFLPVRYGYDISPWDEYLNQFSECNDNSSYIMEATPGYFDGGHKVAEYIKRKLGNIKIIIVLRDPTDRLISFYRYQKAQVNLPKKLSLENYLSECESMPVDLRIKEENDTYWGIDGGRYINYLPGWHSIFSDNMKIVFFDDLVGNPKAIMNELSAWLGLDSEPFDNISYQVENRTVQYKNTLLHKCAISFNKKLEKFMRNKLYLKHLLRSIYYYLNGVTNNTNTTTIDKNKIVEMYREDNNKLREFLYEIGYKQLPQWLASTDKVDT